jgi:hypothetical protein
VARRIHTLLQVTKENLHDARRCHNVSCVILVAVSASPFVSSLSCYGLNQSPDISRLGRSWTSAGSDHGCPGGNATEAQALCYFKLAA